MASNIAPLPVARSYWRVLTALAAELALFVDIKRELGQRPRGRPEDRRGGVCDVEQRLVTGTKHLEGELFVQADRAAGVRAQLGEGDVALRRPRRPLLCEASWGWEIAALRWVRDPDQHRL